MQLKSGGLGCCSRLSKHVELHTAVLILREGSCGALQETNNQLHIQHVLEAADLARSSSGHAARQRQQ